MNGNSAYPDEMQDPLVFMDAVRAAVRTQPDPRLGVSLVPRLAETARSSTLEAETRQLRRGVQARPPMRRRSRLALVARVAIAVALVPLLLAGLAFAGVTVPSPARSAFDSVGITLPNQPSDGHSANTTKKKAGPATEQGGGNEVSNAAQTKQQGQGGNSATAHEHARKQREKARGEAKGHSRGKAVGLNDAVPPGQSGETGPPAHSNAGGNGAAHANGNSSAKGPKTPKAPQIPRTPNGDANGHAKTPPGQLK